jgi:Ubiquitin family
MADHQSNELSTANTDAVDDSPYFSSDMDDDDESWTLQIKTVGEQEPDFTVTLHPEDDLSQLYDEVSSVTGLSREQQRLIYRGRLLAAASSPTKVPDEASSSSGTKDGSAQQTRNQKLKDIVGLTDGHTIHLVRKQERPEEEESAEETIAAAAAETSPSTVTSGSATASLLAALLGVGSEERRNRRAPYRLREEDWNRPDPGSMESVRQGLLTLHTLLPSTQTRQHRQFYRGQWIDCRDTVNQWLEATVVAIAYPNEILPPLENDDRSTVALSFQPTTDPAIAVADLDGRRRLLLEPCDEAESEEQIDGIHYRRRDNNHSVQLLHVHYNGWPVRWDEWIRSDSERIRPFCVRTRHAGQYASPTVQSWMPDAPSTQFTGSDDEAADRHALLPELHRVVETVQELIEAAAANSSSTTVPTRSRHLPWQSPGEDEDERALPSRRSRQRELEALAPLLDRLGRTLTDAAPHVAALAASIEHEEDDDDDDDDSQLETIEEHPRTLGGLLSLLSRDRRRHGQSVASSNAAVPSGDVSASLASSTTGGNEHATTVDAEDDEEEEEATTVDPDHRDFATGFVNTSRGDHRSGTRSSSSRSGNDEVASMLGAYLAAASLGGLTSIGMGEGDGAEGLGRLLRDRGNGGGIDIHIHAVVTAPGLDGGGMGLAAMTGGGATFPTATPVNLTPAGTTGGLGTLFGARDQQSTRRSGSRRFRASNAGVSQQSSNDDDSGIFAELYSETPEPINPNGPTRTSASYASAGTPQRDSETDSDGPPSPSRRSRSRSRSRRRIPTQGSGGSSSRSIGNQRRGGMLGRFFRRNSDNND